MTDSINQQIYEDCATSKFIQSKQNYDMFDSNIITPFDQNTGKSNFDDELRDFESSIQSYDMSPESSKFISCIKNITAKEYYSKVKEFDQLVSNLCNNTKFIVNKDSFERCNRRKVLKSFSVSLKNNSNVAAFELAKDYTLSCQISLKNFIEELAKETLIFNFADRIVFTDV